MIEKVFEGTVNYMRLLDEQGNADALFMPKDLDDKKAVEMYRWMSLTRAADAKMLSLQRQGRADTYAPSLGEEATQVGSAMAMRKGDIFTPNFRQHGVYFVRGWDLVSWFLYWKGYEEGCIVPKEVGGMPYIVPVGTQMVHGMGIAFAQKYLNTGAAVVSYVGDGGTSEGDFYEAMNFAGVYKVPQVFIIENNQWAISVPRSRQSVAKTLAQKGIAAGLPCIQVDGNDVFAVYKATQEALNNARSGPTVIECLTYRMTMHTTADDPAKYRSDDEVNAWKEKDPLDRLGKYLRKKGLWDDKKEQKLASDNLEEIDGAVEKAEKFKPDPKSMFENVYSFMPQTLKEEMDAAEANDFWQEKE